MGFAKTLALIMPLAMAACVTTDEGAGDDDRDGMLPGGGDDSGGTKLVSIDVVDAVVSPGMANKETWDGFGTVPDAVWEGLTVALDAPEPFAAVIEFFGNAAVQQLEKPDPLGTSVLLSTQSPDDGIVKTLATETTNLEDTFTPTWPSPARWSNVAVTSDLRVRVTLLDEDLSNDDAIDVVELNRADIEDALRANQVFHVNVSDQANGQLLFVGVSVRQTGTR